MYVWLHNIGKAYSHFFTWPWGTKSTVLMSDQSVLALGCTGNLCILQFLASLSQGHLLGWRFTKLDFFFIRSRYSECCMGHCAGVFFSIQIPIPSWTGWTQWPADQSWPTGTNEHLCFPGTEVSQSDNHRRRSKYLLYFILIVYLAVACIRICFGWV